MLLGDLRAILLGNLLPGEGTIRSRQRHCWSRSGFLILPNLLTNFEIQKYYEKEPNFNGVYSRNNLPKIKDEVYIINFIEYKSIKTPWMTFYVHDSYITYFDNFGVEHIPKEI